MDKLSILIKSKLDFSDITQDKINKQLKNLKINLKPTLDLSDESIAKFKKDVEKLVRKSKINLKIGVDEQSTKQAEQSVKNMKTNIAKNSTVDLPIFNKTVLEREGREFFARTNDIVDRVQKRYASMGDVNVNLFKNAQGQVTNFTAEIKKADGVVEKFRFNLAKLEGYARSQKGFVYSGANLIDKNFGDNITRTLDKLQLYQNRLSKLQANYMSPKSGIQDAEYLTDLNSKYNNLNTLLNKLKNSNANLSNEQRRTIIQNIHDLDLAIKKYKDLEAVQKVIGRDSKKNTSINKEISEVELLILKYKAATISAKEFIDASTKMFANGRMSGTSNEALEERARLLSTLKTAQIDYNKGSIGDKNVSDKLKLTENAYKHQEQLLKNIYSIRERLVKLNPQDNSKEIAQLEKMLQLQTARLLSSQNRTTNKNLYDEQRYNQYLELENQLKNKLTLTTSKLADADNKRNEKIRQQDLNKLQLYQNKIDKLEAKFTSPITGVKEQENLTALTNKYTQIKNSIDQARLAGTKLTDEQRRGILQNINSLEIEIKRYRDLERIMRTSNTRSLSQDDIALYQETMRNKLANLQVGRMDTVFRRPEIIAEIDRFNNSLIRVGTVGGESVRRVNLQFSQLSTSVRQASSEISRINSQADSLGTTFGKNIFKLGIWAAAATAMYAPLRALRDGLQTLKEIDTELINIAKVTEYTNYEMQKLAGTAVNAGKEFGRTAQEYLQAVTEFSRAGFGQQAQEYGKLSLLLQNVGDVNAETANATLIAANAGFQLGGSYESLMGVIDKFNNVSNRNATTVTKLSEAMKVGASVFHSAGMSMDETVAIIGTATSSTQRAGSEIK